jgi:hypothetical protein
MAMKKKPSARKQVSLLEIQESFEELGWNNPRLTWKEAVLKLGHSSGLVDAKGKPQNLTSVDFLRLCRKAFRSGQRDAKKNKPAITRSAGRMRKMSKKTA